MGVVGRSILGGFAIGTVCSGAVATMAAFWGNSSDSNPPLFAIIVAIGIFAVGFGGAPGAFLGTLVGLVRRSADRSRVPVPHYMPVPMQVDMWSQLVAQCAESARRVAGAVETVPASPAKDWLVRIAEKLARELDDVRGIAQLGRALGAVDQRHPVYQRLQAAAHDFAKFEHEVARVALKMFDHPELDQARTDLEFLEEQLPHLS